MWERSDNQEVGLEAAIFQRKRNSSLVQRTCAENVTGLSIAPKLRTLQSGRIVFYGRRRFTVRRAGAHRRAYAVMSSDKTGEKPVRRKPKVS